MSSDAELELLESYDGKDGDDGLPSLFLIFLLLLEGLRCGKRREETRIFFSMNF